MSSLEDELKADQKAATKCQTCIWLATLPEKDRDEWDRVMANRAYSHPSIHRAIIRRKGVVARGSIETHRANRHGPAQR